MGRLRSVLGRPELGPGLAFVAVLGILSRSDGGFPATTWYPAAIFMLALLGLVAHVFRGRLLLLSRANWLAIGLLGAFAAWNFASILWAGVPGIAWDGANRVLLYLIVFATFSLLPWRASSAGVVLGAYSLVVAAIGIVAVADASGSGNAFGAVIDGRFADPVGYPNGAAALFAMAFWPALLLSSRREVPWPGRALMLATAGLLLQLALLPQSRGALLAFPVALAIFFAVTPRRISVLLALVPVGVATALASGPILDVFSVVEAGGSAGPALSDALRAMAISFASLLVAGAALGVADQRTRPSALAERRLVRGTAIAGTALAVAAVVTAAIAIGNPGTWLDARWHEFKGGYGSASFATTRLNGSLGSNRYDFWRVAIRDEFAADPIVGQGSDNFAVGYLEHRTSNEEPLYPHSLPIRVLAGTGIIGLLLVLGSVAAAVAAAARTRWSAAEPPERAVAAVALGTLGYLALHSAGDWLWSFPAVTMPAFAWMGMAAAMGARRPTGAAAPQFVGGGRRLAAYGLTALLAIVVAASFALPWLSARETAIAASTWEDDPGAAFSRLDRARRLNFLSSQPDLTAGAIASRLDDRRRMREAFSRALERDPDNWYATLELGVLDALEHRRASAIAHLERARELNPRDELIRSALRGARTGHPLSPDRIDRALLARVCSVVGPTDDTRYCK